MVGQADADVPNAAGARHYLMWILWPTVILLCLAACVTYASCDGQVAQWCDKNTNRWCHGLLPRFLRQFGKPFLPFALLVGWATVTRRWRAAMIVVLAVVLMAVSVGGAKYAVRRPRPGEMIKAVAGMKSEEKGFFQSWSFPSGDTAQAFAMAVALAPFIGVPWRLGVFAMACVVGVLRVLGNFHYPSDVLVGAAAGIVCGWLTLVTAERWLSRAPPKWWPRRFGRYWDNGRHM
jgi:membrane-associated phospholipid phosphatase